MVKSQGLGVVAGGFPITGVSVVAIVGLFFTTQSVPLNSQVVSTPFLVPCTVFHTILVLNPGCVLRYAETLAGSFCFPTTPHEEGVGCGAVVVVGTVGTVGACGV